MKKLCSLFLLALVSACMSFGSTPPARFFSLQIIAEPQTVSKSRASIGVEEVNIPEYLDKPQIVTVSDNMVELNISEHNRWSEPLSTMMQRTIANDMASLLPNAVVKSRNMGNERFDYAVFIEVDKFDGALNGKAQLNAWWYVLKKGSSDIVLRQKAAFSQPVGGDYDDLVRAESRLVAQLAEQIAVKISGLSK